MITTPFSYLVNLSLYFHSITITLFSLSIFQSICFYFPISTISLLQSYRLQTQIGKLKNSSLINFYILKKLINRIIIIDLNCNQHQLQTPPPSSNNRNQLQQYLSIIITYLKEQLNINQNLSIKKQIKKQLPLKSSEPYILIKQSYQKQQQSTKNRYPSSYSNNKAMAKIQNTFTEAQFMKLYQENIKIKKELQQKNSYITQLKNKLQLQLIQNKTTNLHQELRILKQQTKKNNPLRPKQSAKKISYNFQSMSGQTKKLQSLLQIIQSYKQKLLISQQQCANLRQQKYILEQDIKLNNKSYKDRNIKNVQKSYLEGSIQQRQRKQDKQDELLTKLRQKTSQLQLEKQRNRFVQAELRRLENKQKALQMETDSIEQLRVENRILQQRIMKLTMITDTTDNQRDYRSLQDKNRQLETKLKAGLEKYNKIKEEKNKIQIDYKLLQNKLIEIQHELQETQKENLHLKKNQVNDPLVQRLIKNKTLLAQLIGELESPDTFNKEKAQSKYHSSFESAQKLILEKQALAIELIEVKNKMKLLEESWRQKETMIKIEKEQMLAQIKLSANDGVSGQNVHNKLAKNYTSKQGVQYDGDISMFSDERITVTKSVNYFDIYLGRVNLIQSLVKAVTPLSTSSPLLMATVDFYNFPTENTKLSQGMVAELNTEFVFKISEEEFFFKFLMKESLKISIWATQGNKNYLIGHVEVSLRQLLLKNKPNIAPVNNTSSPIINGQKVVGTIFYDMRMRLPVYDQSQKLLSQPISSVQNTNNDTQAQQRKLIVQIDQGSGFKQASKLFVYYSFRLEDYYTRTFPGPAPKWAHYKMIDLKYDEDTKNYLKKTQLELTVFDDSVGIDDKDNDVVGTGAVSLTALLQNKVIREKITIRKNGIVTGNLQIKLFWYESSIKDKPSDTQNKKSKHQLLQLLHADILQHINAINSTAQKQFKRIDSNSTGMISFDEFYLWVIKIRQSQKYSRQIVSIYYDSFQQPLNLLNWIAKLSQRYEDKNDNQTELMPELSEINQLLKKNSLHIDTKVSLQEYLKDKNMLNVTLDIDANGNGEISRQQLINYMNRHNVVLDESEIEGESVNLIKFLKKYGK